MTFPRDLTDPETYPLLPGLAFFAKKTTTDGDDDEADDEDEFDTGDGDDDSKDDADDEDDDEEESEDELPESVKKILKKNRADTRAAEKRARTAEAKLREGKKKPKEKPDADDEDDDEDKVARASAPAIRLAKRTKAEKALDRAGLVLGDDEEKSYARAVRLLDLDELDLDIETGRIEGLSDAIADLKEDMPSLFTRKRTRARINGDDDKGRDEKPRKKLSASEEQAESLKPGSVTGRRR